MMSSIVDTMRRNAAIRMTTQCLRCSCYIPFVECVAMNNIDETHECKIFKSFGEYKS